MTTRGRVGADAGCSADSNPKVRHHHAAEAEASLTANAMCGTTATAGPATTASTPVAGSSGTPALAAGPPGSASPGSASPGTTSSGSAPVEAAPGEAAQVSAASADPVLTATSRLIGSALPTTLSPAVPWLVVPLLARSLTGELLAAPFSATMGMASDRP
jgi:hypothetical protein